MSINTKVNRSQRWVGIDVGKTFLDTYTLELDHHWQLHSTQQNVKEIN
jgi:hypothetical protein